MRTASPKSAVVRLSPEDNVVVTTRPLTAGVAIDGEQVIVRQSMDAGHKIATHPIAQGQPVLKYGQVIGAATAAIAPGEHVHVHNLAVSAHRRAPGSRTGPRLEVAPRTFEGYRRPDGRVGVRNYVGILTSVNCSATVARLIAEAAERSGLLDDYPGVDGVVALTHASGCGMAASGEGFDLLRRTLWGAAANPNFGGVLLVGLGCEVIQTGQLARDFGLAGQETFRSFTIQEVGGTRHAVERGLEHLRDLLEVAGRARRSTVPASALTVGLQCGGSDAWSGLTSNPALGAAVDRLVALGGAAILSETPEIYGAEHLLLVRATSPEVAARLKARLAWWEDYTARHGAQMNSNPSPGNIAGGLTTILEKSLGAVAKSGTSPLRDVIEYARPLTSRGLVFMDSPGFDPCSATGQLASGATLIAFTTGRGSAYGCKPSPAIKLSSNSALYARMSDDLDLNCGDIADGERTVDEKGEEILDLMLAVASGQRTQSERLGYGGAEFVPWQLGAVM